MGSRKSAPSKIWSLVDKIKKFKQFMMFMMSITNTSSMIILDARLLFGRGYSLLWKPFKQILQQAYYEFTAHSAHSFPISTFNRLLPEDVGTIENLIHAAIRIAHEDAVKNATQIDPETKINGQKFFDWIQLCQNSMVDMLTSEACDFLDHLTDFQQQRADKKQSIHPFLFISPYPFFKELFGIVSPQLNCLIIPVPEERIAAALNIRLIPQVSNVHVISSDPHFLGGPGLKGMLLNGHEIPVDMCFVPTHGQKNLHATPQALAQIMKDIETWVPEPKNVVVPEHVLMATRKSHQELVSRLATATEVPAVSLQSAGEHIGDQPQWMKEWSDNPPQHQIFLNVHTGLNERASLKMVQDAIRTSYDMALTTLCPKNLQKEVLNQKGKYHAADSILLRYMEDGKPLPAAEEMIDMIIARLSAEQNFAAISLGGYGRERLIEDIEQIYWRVLEENIEPCLGRDFILFCHELSELQQHIIATRTPVDFAIVAPTQADAVLASAVMPVDTQRIFIIPNSPDDNLMLLWPAWPQTSFMTISNSPYFDLELSKNKIETAYVVGEDLSLTIIKDKPNNKILGASQDVIEALYKRLRLKRAMHPNTNLLAKELRIKPGHSDGPDIV